VVVTGRSGPEASSPGRRGRTWRSSMTPMSAPTGSRGAPASVGTTWTGRRIWGSPAANQQHEIPQVSVWITEYDQHAVRRGCGRAHTAARPGGARSGPVGYGPNLAAFAAYLLVVRFIPAHRVVALPQSPTGASPSVGFCHGMLARAAGCLSEVDKRIQTLITLAHTVSCVETPLRVGCR